eukprot:6557829-Pyramimonas_sp.AAC.1
MHPMKKASLVLLVWRGPGERAARTPQRTTSQNGALSSPTSESGRPDSLHRSQDVQHSVCPSSGLICKSRATCHKINPPQCQPHTPTDMYKLSRPC